MRKLAVKCTEVMRKDAVNLRHIPVKVLHGKIYPEVKLCPRFGDQRDILIQDSSLFYILYFVGTGDIFVSRWTTGYGEEYDYRSIMHYSSRAFVKDIKSRFYHLHFVLLINALLNVLIYVLIYVMIYYQLFNELINYNLY